MMTWLPATTSGMLITSPTTSGDRLPFAAPATAITLSTLIMRSATMTVVTAAWSRPLAGTWRPAPSSLAISLIPIPRSNAPATSWR